MLDQAISLNNRLRALELSELSQVLKTNPKLTALSREKITQFSVPHTLGNGGAALAVFKGDAFSALTISRYTNEDFEHADRHIRILSGLYGILRPLDLIQSYRLEMGTRMETGRGLSLYDFWGDLVTARLNDDLQELQSRLIINCASAEYSKVVRKKNLKRGNDHPHLQAGKGRQDQNHCDLLEKSPRAVHRVFHQEQGFPTVPNHGFQRRRLPAQGRPFFTVRTRFRQETGVNLGPGRSADIILPIAHAVTAKVLSLLLLSCHCSGDICL